MIARIQARTLVCVTHTHAARTQGGAYATREREQENVARRYQKVTEQLSATAARKRHDKRKKGGECGVRHQRDRCRKLPPQSVGGLLQRRQAPCGRRKRDQPV